MPSKKVFRHSWADGWDFVNLFCFFDRGRLFLPALPHISGSLIHSFSALIGRQFSLFLIVTLKVVWKFFKAP